MTLKFWSFLFDNLTEVLLVSTKSLGYTSSISSSQGSHSDLDFSRGNSCCENCFIMSVELFDESSEFRFTWPGFAFWYPFIS